MLSLLIKTGLTIAVVFLAINSFSQGKLAKDIQLIKKIKIDEGSEPDTIRSYIYSKETSAFKKYNPVNIAFGGLLFLYQNTLSPQFSATCLYNPSCSDFSKQSITEYGLVKGVFLSADRIMRCNRMAATGIHPLRIENHKAIDPVDFYILKK